MNYIFFTIPLL